MAERLGRIFLEKVRFLWKLFCDILRNYTIRFMKFQQDLGKYSVVASKSDREIDRLTGIFNIFYKKILIFRVGLSFEEKIEAIYT
jgi:hypothetical protein